MVNATSKVRTQDGWRPRRLSGIAGGGAGETLVHGEVGHRVLASGGSPKAGRGGDRRADAREPMRLRSAKLLDPAFRFISECRICDRSKRGLRIALARNLRLPWRFAVHFDETGEIRCATTVWRRGLTIGVRLYGHASGIKPCDRIALRERYYGILD